jgi:cell division protein FtsA
VVPIRYSLDSYYNGNNPPLGMGGNQLIISLMMVFAPMASIDQIETHIKDEGCVVRNWWYSGISSAEAVMVPASEAGVAVVDIGAASTDVAVYQQGQLKHIASLERGGRDIDSDLAVYMNESMSVAEAVKRRYGCALPEVVSYNEMIDLRASGFASDKLVSAQDVAVKIKARLQELLYLVNEEIGKGLEIKQVSRIIFTGGVANIAGFTELAEDILDRNVELGQPGAVDGTTMGFTDTSCSALIGTLSMISKQQTDSVTLDHTAMTGMQRLGTWLKALVKPSFAEQREAL